MKKGAKKTMLKVAGGRQRQANANSTLAVKSVKAIAVYPVTEDQRKRIRNAAADHGNSMSGFLIYLFRQYEKSKGGEVKTA